MCCNSDGHSEQTGARVVPGPHGLWKCIECHRGRSRGKAFWVLMDGMPIKSCSEEFCLTIHSGVSRVLFQELWQNK
ncbi:hypothetical protein Y1Q_0007755 [Alligator mississippiensis]|uniref:Uncharacterized protein n=1 Tax=Alligator mississippiensis TaxID=8496 RepID=A0A151N6S9_ALLMI|nr:hypothetical protein Y1Q_0007755 [Alligator mississippiensis]